MCLQTNTNVLAHASTMAGVTSEAVLWLSTIVVHTENSGTQPTATCDKNNSFSFSISLLKGGGGGHADPAAWDQQIQVITGGLSDYCLFSVGCGRGWGDSCSPRAQGPLCCLLSRHLSPWGDVLFNWLLRKQQSFRQTGSRNQDPINLKRHRHVIRITRLIWKGILVGAGVGAAGGRA